VSDWGFGAQRRPTDKMAQEGLNFFTLHVYCMHLYLYRSIDSHIPSLDYRYLAMVNYRGRVFWVPTATFRSGCEIDMKRFPFDEQRLKRPLLSTYWNDRFCLEFFRLKYIVCDFFRFRHFAILCFNAVAGISFGVQYGGGERTTEWGFEPVNHPITTALLCSH